MWLGTCPVGEISSRVAVVVGKCLAGEVYIGEVSGRQMFRSGKYSSEKCPSTKCHLYICNICLLPAFNYYNIE